MSHTSTLHRLQTGRLISFSLSPPSPPPQHTDAHDNTTTTISTTHRSLDETPQFCQCQTLCQSLNVTSVSQGIRMRDHNHCSRADIYRLVGATMCSEVFFVSKDLELENFFGEKVSKEIGIASIAMAGRIGVRGRSERFQGARNSRRQPICNAGRA